MMHPILLYTWPLTITLNETTETAMITEAVRDLRQLRDIAVVEAFQCTHPLCCNRHVATVTMCFPLYFIHEHDSCWLCHVLCCVQALQSTASVIASGYIFD
jgi:hypothetical protein